MTDPRFYDWILFFDLKSKPVLLCDGRGNDVNIHNDAFNHLFRTQQQNVQNPKGYIIGSSIYVSSKCAWKYKLKKIAFTPEYVFFDVPFGFFLTRALFPNKFHVNGVVYRLHKTIHSFPPMSIKSCTYTAVKSDCYLDFFKQYFPAFLKSIDWAARGRFVTFIIKYILILVDYCLRLPFANFLLKTMPTRRIIAFRVDDES